MVQAVFFPAMMGVGILASGFLILYDLVRRLLPNHGRHRQQRTAAGIRGVVASAAAATGCEVHSSDPFERRPRRRSAYVGLAMFTFGLAVLTVWTCMSAYTSPGNLLRGSLWMPGFAIAGGVLFGGFAVLCLTLAAHTPDLPPSLRRLVESTTLGQMHFAESLVVITTPPRKEHG